MNTKSGSWFTARASGVLAHLSSLPGEFGIGNFGEPARNFIDFLAEAGFHYWQICPLGPTGYGDSPYQSFSTFAGNPYFIDLSELVDLGYLVPADFQSLRGFPGRNVHYGLLYQHFWPVLETAYNRYAENPAPLPGAEPLAAFRKRNAHWLEDYAIFMGLKRYYGGRSWLEWPEAYRNLHPADFANLPESIQLEADRRVFYQYLFEVQWQRLRDYAAMRSVEIIGDLPIFVALDSSDTWRNREIFKLHADGEPMAYAGVPPDYFSERGQFWGNPLYDWATLRRSGYGWWISRLQRVFELYDVIRLDHFRAFDTYWEIPAGSTDARQGSWKQGPGRDFLDTVRRAIPDAKIIAEDLGYITPGVVDLRRHAGLPGMKIMQFAYGHDDNNVNLPHFHPPDSVVYSGTHDNDTLRGWLSGLKEPIAGQVHEYFGLGGRSGIWPILKATFASPSRLAVIALQDLMNMDSSARMNRPGTSEGNWIWRFSQSDLNRLRRNSGNKIRELHRLYDRFYDERQRDYSAPPSAE